MAFCSSLGQKSILSFNSPSAFEVKGPTSRAPRASPAQYCCVAVAMARRSAMYAASVGYRRWSTRISSVARSIGCDT